MLLEVLREVENIKCDFLVIGGDFNCKEINWSDKVVGAGSGHYSQSLFDCINDLFLDQLVVEPTRFREGERSNTLDWILTDIP